MINNEEEYDKAKNESEPLFDSTQYINGNRLKKGCLATIEQDCRLHADEIGVIKDLKTNEYVVATIDVKHVEKHNFGSGNYSLSYDLIDYVLLSMHDKDEVIKIVKEKPILQNVLKHHYLALRIVAKDIQTNTWFETNDFLLVETKDVIEKCKFIVMNKDRNDTYFLVNIDDIRSKCVTSIEKA